MNVGIMCPRMPITIGYAVPYADLARSGGHRLWFGHSIHSDSLMLAAALTARGYVIPFGMAVLLFPLWHPRGFADQTLTLARLSGHPVIAGIGPGSPDFQQQTLGERLGRPVTATEAFATQTRNITDPIQLDSGLPDEAGRAVAMGFGALRPAMARAAGRTADWLITWLAPRNYLSEVLIPAASASAETADRPAPRVASVIHCAVRREGRDPLALAEAASRDHVKQPHYSDMLHRAGLRFDPGDVTAAARQLVDTGTYLYGTAAEIVDGLEQFEAAGATEVVLNLSGLLATHGDIDVQIDLEDILDEVHARSVAKRLAAPAVEPAHPAEAGVAR